MSGYLTHLSARAVAWEWGSPGPFPQLCGIAENLVKFVATVVNQACACYALARNRLGL